MNFLFEYGEWATVDRPSDLKKLLKDTWDRQLATFSELKVADSDEENSYQPFIQFDGNKIRAKNFVGFIQNGEELIEIYPKVFRKDNCDNKALMLRHVFFWFSYCRKWRFPFNQANLDDDNIDRFPELIIHLIAKQIFDTVSTQPLMQYQMLEETMATPRGSINFGRYIKNGFSRGYFHQVDCDYEPFLFDNKVNRIIKYCARILLAQSRLNENIHLLQDSLYILDEVDDITCSAEDINQIALNSFYQDYSLLMDSCKLVINQHIYSNNNYDLSQWCLLFPMEYIFEDFIAGFLEHHFSDKWIVHYQKSDQYLSNDPRVFNMQQDIFLISKEDENRKIIIDTKYKIRDDYFKNDPKKGIQQSDMYQMVSYACKRGCTEVFLFYPNISEFVNESDTFNIKTGFDISDVIKVTAIEVPFWSIENLKFLEVKLIDQLTNTIK